MSVHDTKHTIAACLLRRHARKPVCLDQGSGLTFEQAHAIGMAGKCLDAHICMPACAKVEAAPFAPGRERCGLTRYRVGGLTRLGLREPLRGSHRPQRVICPVLLRPRCAILGWGSEAPFTKIKKRTKAACFLIQ